MSISFTTYQGLTPVEHTCSQIVNIYPLNIQRTEDFDLRCFTLLTPETSVEGDQSSSPCLVSVLSMARFDKAKIVLSPFLSVLEYKVENTVLKILVDNTLDTNRDFKAFWTEKESKIYLIAVGEKNKLRERSVEKPYCPDCCSEVKRIIQIELNLAGLNASQKIDVYTFVPVSSVKQQVGSLVRTQHLIPDREELVTSIFI